MKSITFEGTSFNVDLLLEKGKEAAVKEVAAAHWQGKNADERKQLATGLWDMISKDEPKRRKK